MSKSFERVKTRIWRAAGLDEAEFLRGSFADFAYDLHTHQTACFALLTRGAIRIQMRGSEFTAREGDLFAIDADRPHTGWPVDANGWSLRTLYVDLSRLATHVDDHASRIPVALSGPIIRDRTLAAFFHDLHRCAEVDGPVLRREERYLGFIARLFERHTRETPRMADAGCEDRAIHLARDFLDQHLDQRVHLADIAAAAGLPPFTLLRAFVRATGMSPHTYQRQARIHCASDLLRLGHPPGDVAAACGFADQAHLTRSFRRSIGVTPGMYRAAVRSAVRRCPGI